MADYNRESQVGLIADYFQENPGLLISVAYLLLTLCGIFYSVTFYGGFGIAILKLADISDLMISGLSDPAAIVMFSGGLLVAWSFDKMSQYSFGVRSRWVNKPKTILRIIVLTLNYVPKSKMSILIGLLGIFVVYAFLFVSLYSDWRSSFIKKGDGHKIVIETLSDKEPHSYTLLGSTSNYLLIYDTQTEAAKIIPIDNVTMLVPVTDEIKTIEHN